MTYYNPHPAHVLVADSLFESRKKLIRELLAEPDYCERWDLAYKLLEKYTRREVYALADKLERDIISLDLRVVCGDLADHMALMGEHAPTYYMARADMLANPAKSLPLSTQWGSMENEQQY